MKHQAAKTPGEEDWDPRNHRSVILPGFLFESLSALPESKKGAANFLSGDALDFYDDFLFNWTRRRMALDSTLDGKLRDLVGKIALHDEALVVTESENVTRVDV